MTARRNTRAQRARQRQRQTERPLSAWLEYRLIDMAARNCRTRSIAWHRQCVTMFIKWLGDVAPAEVTPEDIERWRDEKLATCKPGTVRTYIINVGSLFNWLVDEKVLDESPTLAVELPPEDWNTDAPPVIDLETFGRIIAAARTTGRGRSQFTATRDEAMLSLFLDTGLRSSEIAAVLLDSLDLKARQLLVHEEASKGGYSARTVTFGNNTARLLARYLRARDEHGYQWCDELFIGERGPMSYAAVYEMVKACARRAGVLGMRPHLLRHTWTHLMKETGLSDEVIMSLGGWASPKMLQRYGRAQRTARAVEAYQRSGSPIDRASVRRNSSVA